MGIVKCGGGETEFEMKGIECGEVVAGLTVDKISVSQTPGSKRNLATAEGFIEFPYRVVAPANCRCERVIKKVFSFRCKVEGLMEG